MRQNCFRTRLSVPAFVILLGLASGPLAAQPTMLHPRLGVRQVVGGLNLPTALAFIGPNDMLVLEKNTGRVQRVVNGALHSTALDLAVNNSSERGLLGIALHPDFPSNPGVYLYWTCQAAPPPPDSPFFPTETECGDVPATGADSSDILAVPLRGNRVDRFVWNGAALVFDHNLIKLRAFQSDGGPVPPGQGDEGQPARGNHDGGVLAFGPDEKLYVFVGDLGRRGALQNLEFGPRAGDSGVTTPDDQFGGPAPDPSRLSGVILRLNDDGSTPLDNPFYTVGANIGGDTGATVQKIFAYGFRNSFGMAFDGTSARLWLQENGDDTFSEINLVEPGMNGGWIQFAGPSARIEQFKEMETTFGGRNLQQLRWPPTNIADTASDAMRRLFKLPGAHYSEPEFSWKWEVAPGGIGFMNSRALGRQFEGSLFVGAGTPLLNGGYLFRFRLTGNRQKIAVSDPRLNDRVADNLAKHEITESESLLIGRDFGVVTDIETGPNGNLFVVSLSGGAVYEIFGQ